MPYVSVTFAPEDYQVIWGAMTPGAAFTNME